MTAYSIKELNSSSRVILYHKAPLKSPTHVKIMLKKYPSKVSEEAASSRRNLKKRSLHKA
jgi:hypothetical protein